MQSIFLLKLIAQSPTSYKSNAKWCNTTLFNVQALKCNALTMQWNMTQGCTRECNTMQLTLFLGTNCYCAHFLLLHLSPSCPGQVPQKNLRHSLSCFGETEQRILKSLMCATCIETFANCQTHPIITMIQTIYNLEVESRRLVSCRRGKVWSHNSVKFDVNLISLQQVPLEGGK